MINFTHIILLMLFFFGCNFIVDGCTDPSACNYEPSADTDNGTCFYADQNKMQ